MVYERGNGRSHQRGAYYGGANAVETASFLERCRPKLRELEQLRLEKLDLFETRKKLAVPIGFLMMPVLGLIDYWLLFFAGSGDDRGAGLTIIAGAMLWGWVTKPRRDYARGYKTRILPDIAGLFGNFTYEARGKIPMHVMKPSKIVPGHTRYLTEDFFSGEHRGVGIHFSEVDLQKKSGKSTRTVFKGLALLLTDGTKRFHGHTILVRDQGRLGKWFKKQTAGLRRADMTDPEFESLFDVYTSDQVEARYLMDPRIIENLKTLYNDYHGNNMMVAFYDTYVLVLIGSNENHFEPAAIEVPATSEHAVLAMKHEIEQILSIIDRLSLYDPKQRRRADASREQETGQAASPWSRD